MYEGRGWAVLDGLRVRGEGLGGFGWSACTRGGVGRFWMVCVYEGRGWAVLDGLRSKELSMLGGNMKTPKSHVNNYQWPS